MSSSGLEPAPFGYRGEYTDEETKFVYLRARYYDPKIGRFINEDPALDGLNWYAYCGNDPINRVDPSGLTARRVCSMASVPVSRKRVYYFHGRDQREHAKRNVEDLRRNGKVTRYATHSSTRFKEKWDALPNSVDIVVINVHGATESSKNIGGPHILNRKKIDTLVLLTCNGGHRDLRDNLARRFLRNHSIRQLVAVDGYHMRRSDTGGWVSSLNPNFDSNGVRLPSAFWNNVSSITRSPGLVLYNRNGGFVRTLGMEYSSVGSILRSVGK